MTVRKNFSGDTRGNIAILFALSLTVIIALVGGAVDFSINAKVRAQLQNATDAAVLAAASPFIEDSERETVANRVLASELSRHNFSYAYSPHLNITPDNTVTLRVDADVPTNFLKIIGMNTTTADSLSVASQSVSDIELALVLDVSGSMNAGFGVGETRMDVLQRAAKDLVDVLAANSLGGAPKFSIVPFNMNVNVGTANSAFVKNTTDPLFAGASWAGCVLERAGMHANSDAYSAAAPGANGKWQAYIWPPEPDSGTCINKSNGTNSGYLTVDPGVAGSYSVKTSGPNFNCVRHPIFALSDVTSDVRTKIDTLTAEFNQGTIIAPGVAWGMRTLTPGEPFTEGEPKTPSVRKIMVVLTDGQQTTEGEFGGQTGCDTDTNSTDPYTFDPASFGLDGDPISGTGPTDMFSAYGYIRDSDPFGSNPASWDDVADDLYDVSIDACDEAKKNANGKIEIYSIAVSTAAGPGTKTYDLLRNCASDPAHFYYAADASDLTAAFKRIAEEVLNVRLTK